MGKGNGECSPSTEQLFGIDMVGMMGSTSHPLDFHLLEHLNFSLDRASKNSLQVELNYTVFCI
jgi:hypothetical protein